MISFKSLAFSVVLVAVGVQLCADWTQAQKTRQNTYQPQQQQQQFSGSGQESVYGGYQAAPANRPSSLAAPVNQQRRPQQQARPQPTYQQQPQQQPIGAASSSDDQQAEADAEPASYGAVAGSPGTDFPNYARVPKTSFTCAGVPYEYGMYADEETGCQAYHLCYNGRKDSFLCGPGTVFNQRILHCDYWYSVDCAKSSQYYDSNAYMGSSQPEPGPAQASGSSAQSSIRRPEASSNRPASFQRPNSPAPPSSYRNTQQTQQQLTQQEEQESY